MSGLDQYVLRSLSDWRFFFQLASASMGIRAIDYEKMACASANPTKHAGPTEEHLIASRRHARIAHRLLAMPSRSLLIVRAVCDRPPRELWEPFAASSGLGNLADLSAAAARAHTASRTTRDLASWLDRLGAKLTSGRATASDRTVRERIGIDCETIIAAAHKEYDEARKAVT